MPLRSNVELVLDDSSLSDLRNRAESHLSSVGQTAGQSFTKGLSRELDQIGPSFVRLGSVAESALGGISTGAIIATAGIAAVAVAAVEVNQAFYDMGARFDAISDSIAARTGKLGDDLTGLMGSLNTVGSTTASSLDDIGDVLGRVSQSLGASGADLEYLTKQILDLDRMTGENLNVRDLGRVMRAFGQDAGQAAADLDSLEAASQRTGIPLNELLSEMVHTSAAAKSLHLDFNQLAGLLVLFEKAGLDAGNAQMALNHAAGEFAKHGIDMATGLADTITQMKQLLSTGNEFDEQRARRLAGDVWGERAAARFFDLVKSGVLDADTLNRGLGDTQGTIERLDKATADWHETWQKITNQVDILIDRVGGPLFKAVNDLLKIVVPDIPVWQQPQSPPFPTATPYPGGIEPGYVHPQDPYTPTVIPPGGWQPHTYDQSTAPRPGQPGFIGPVPAGTPQQAIPQMGPPSGAPPLSAPPPGGAQPGQDIEGAIGSKPGEPGGKPGAPAIPMPAEYGQPPRPGETLEDWQRRQRVMEAENDIAEKKARLAQMEAANNDADEKNNFTQDEITKERTAITAAENRLYVLEHENIIKRKTNLDLVQVPYPAGFGAAPRPGETAEQYSKEQATYEATHRREQAEAQLAQIRNDPQSSPDAIVKAENAVASARQNEYETLLRLTDATKRGTDQLQDFGAKIDADFGASKGLPGLAENLTKFLANLAFAPVFGAMGGAQAALGFPGGRGAGSGIVGVIANAAGFGQQSAGSTGVLGQIGAGPFGQMGVGPFGISPQISGQTGQTAQTTGRLYGLTADQVAAQQFPPEIVQLGARFNLKPSTYPGHQSGATTAQSQLGVPIAPNPEGLNRGIDWVGSQADMDRFSEFLIASGMPGLEQVIHRDPNTGRDYGYPAGVNYPFGEETGMVHTRFSQIPGGGAMGVRSQPGAMGVRSQPGAMGVRSQPGAMGVRSQPGRAPTGLSRNEASAYQAMINAGFSPAEWPALKQLITHESGFNPTARNRSSGAFGMYQFLGHESDKYGELGAYSPDPGLQSIAGMQYIKDRYGSPANAWAFWQSHNWYQEGGPIPSGGAVPIVAHEGEHVFTSKDVNAMGGQQAVYDFRADLHQPKATPPMTPGAVMPTFGGPMGGPMPAVSPIGSIAPPAGHGAGLSVTGGGLVGVAESIPATVIEMAIAAGASTHYYGGAIERYADGGEIPSALGPSGGGGISAPSGVPGGGPPGGSLISAAINIGMAELNNAIGYGGRAIGAVVSGLQQTFGPDQFSQSKMGQQSWVTRFVGGIMGAQPQLPNLAGMMSQPPPAAPGITQGTGPFAGTSGNSGGPLVNIENYHANAGEDRAGADIARHTQAAYSESSLTGSR